METVLAHAELFDGDAMRGAMDVVIAEGRIADIVAAGTGRGDAVVDLGGRLLAPGFVDVQVNGGGGELFNNAPTVQTLRTMAEAHRRFGTTSLLPTLITDSTEVMVAAAEAIRAAIRERVPGVRGVHFEGPCLNPVRKGVHSESDFRELSDELTRIYTGQDLGAVVVTLAPEMVPPETIRKLAEAGVLVSAGHTEGTHADIAGALAAGLRGFTHLYNAMSPMTNREPGVVGAALDDAGSWCGIIIDGHHLHDATARNALRAKAPGRMMLVTDAMSTVGAADKTFTLYGDRIHAENGRLARADGTLAGSDLDMMTAVRNTHRRLGVDLGEALRMAALYPAQFLKLDARIGRVAPGHDADLVVIDPVELTVAGTFIAGEGMPARMTETAP